MRRFIGMFLLLLFLTASACASPSPAPDSVIESVPTSQPLPVATAIPKQKDLIFIEFYAITWMDCKLMDPIVHGIKQKYSQCMKMEQANFHQHTKWHDLIYPLAAPEFALLDSSLNIIHRWFGVTDEEEFSAVIDPLCDGKQ